MVLRNIQKCTAKINTKNPDPDPNKFENAGSGSVHNVFGSATLNVTKFCYILSLILEYAIRIPFLHGRV